jgi:hypothetical protein
MSKMWLEFKEERIFLLFFNPFVLATFKKIQSKYGNFKRVLPQNVATLLHFFQKSLCSLHTILQYLSGLGTNYIIILNAQIFNFFFSFKKTNFFCEGN